MPASGSSPHTRGALAASLAVESTEGIIPAYAGSTFMPMPRADMDWDHPRIRGEHGALWTPNRDQPGSSPHTRGAHVAERPPIPPDRIIPAYAGSTYAAHKVAIESGDHPRIRGEHAIERKMMTSAPGSSPHTRGARRRRVGELGLGGIIPAYAGSTSCIALRQFARPGSSPHTRGALRASISPPR